LGHAGQDALALKQLKALGVDWFYGWRSRPTVNYPGWVPMVRDPKKLLEQGAIRYLTESGLPAGVQRA
jgi:hypothetical protein